MDMMTLGKQIAYYRKEWGLTPEALANRLSVTNQAVSKWETDQCCPDTMLLPKIADVFGITIDELFGREPAAAGERELPWENDDLLRVVLFAGHTLVGAVDKRNQNCAFHYEGPAKDIHCAVNLYCEDVAGSVHADGNIECGDVGGSVTAGGYVECGDVGSGLQSGSYVECGDVEGDLNASSYVECGDVGGNVNAMSYVECGDVGGNVAASGYVECGDIGGSAKKENDSGFSFKWKK